MNTQLQWDDLDDADMNSVWEADSAYHDEGVPFRYRLCPKLEYNKIRWCDHSPGELVGMRSRRSWDSLKEAKKELQSDHDKSLEFLRLAAQTEGERP